MTPQLSRDICLILIHVKSCPIHVLQPFVTTVCYVMALYLKGELPIDPEQV